jgi:probable addiction module antidote protein
MTVKTEKPLPFDMVSFLDSDEMIREYLSQVLEDGDNKELLSALGYISNAKGIAIVSR